MIDLEMTGLNAKCDAILELGAVRVRGGAAVDSYSTLLKTGRRLSPELTELTGITEQMAECGKEPETAMEEFFAFLGEDILVGQNVIFDYSFLKQWAVNHGFSFERNAVDTLKLARTFLPAEQKKNLESLCAYFGVERRNAHRALDDAMETWQILERMKKDYGAEHAKDFLPHPLLYRAKKQTPATGRQIAYLKRYAAYYQIELPQELGTLTRSEASRLTDRLIAQHGKLPQGVLE